MFTPQIHRTTTSSAIAMAELIYHNTVRSVRKSHHNAVIGLLLNIAQSLIMVAGFYGMFAAMGRTSSGIRGDYLLYIMSGIFLFMVHAKAMGAVVASEGPASPMMKHLPMNTAVSILSAALGSLYEQVVSIFVILLGYHVFITPITIFDPVGAFNMVLLAWFSGVAIGVLFLAFKPWSPHSVTIAASAYGRVNMLASGKMVVANALPGKTVRLFDWNPLFHAIDQARGFVFINYTPHNSTIFYAVWISLVILLIGLMAEYHTRRYASESWSARQ